MVIIKFGGSSVGSSERILNVIEIIKKYYQKDLAGVVFSAYSGVTDKLIRIAKNAEMHNQVYISEFEEIKRIHLETAKETISLTPTKLNSILRFIDAELGTLKEILDGVYLLRELSSKSLDFIQSFGERLSCYTISEALKSRGVDCDYLDARLLVKTNNQFNNARIIKDKTYQLISDYFSKNKKIQIITGFIGSTELNETTTLGRGGSDFTAAIFGAALKASRIDIWTDVDGVMTTDPRKVKDSRIIPVLSYAETMELSYFGAKVIYAPTIQPAEELDIPIYIKNTFNPEYPGTKIHNEYSDTKGEITGLASIEDINVLRLEGPGLVGSVGFAGRVFSVLAKNGINIILISQASSEHSICFAINSKDAASAIRSLNSELEYELNTKQLELIENLENLAIIAIVGENMRSKPGLAGKIFNTLGNKGINIIAIAQGSSELNISAIIRKDQLKDALNAIHSKFFNEHKASIYLAGPGNIGKRLLEIIGKNNGRKGKIKISGIIDSKKMHFPASDDEIIKNIDNVKNLMSEEANPDKFIDSMKSDNSEVRIFVDTTASNDIPKLYPQILKSNINIVSANKIANSGTKEDYLRLKKSLEETNSRFLFETNVGAALPVVNTIMNLINAGDKISRIEGILSGTLNFILTEYMDGKDFNEAVENAKRLGLTEPDPAIDLSGIDVARKILILARQCGYNGELADVITLSLDKPESLSQLEKLRETAIKKNEKLKYVAVFDGENLFTELKSVPANHPFYMINGKLNCVIIHSEMYDPEPLIVSGYGAGYNLTAAGVYADIMNLI